MCGADTQVGHPAGPVWLVHHLGYHHHLRRGGHPAEQCLLVDLADGEAARRRGSRPRRRGSCGTAGGRPPPGPPPSGRPPTAGPGPARAARGSAAAGAAAAGRTPAPDDLGIGPLIRWIERLASLDRDPPRTHRQSITQLHQSHGPGRVVLRIASRPRAAGTWDTGSRSRLASTDGRPVELALPVEGVPPPPPPAPAVSVRADGSLLQRRSPRIPLTCHPDMSL